MILGRWITSIAQCRQAAFLAHLCLSRLLLDRFCSCCSVLKQSQAISCNLLEPKDLETNGTLVPCSWNEAFPWCRAPPYGSPCTGMTKSDLGVDLAELAFVSACVAGVVGSDCDCFVYHLVVYIYIYYIIYWYISCIYLYVSVIYNHHIYGAGLRARPPPPMVMVPLTSPRPSRNSTSNTYSCSTT